MTGRAPGRPAIRSPTSACWRPPAAADGAPGVRPIVLRDVGPQGIGLLISGTSPKWEPLSSGRYELLLLWLTIRRQYRVRGTLAPMPDALVETYWNQKVHESRLLDVYYATYGAAVERRPVARAVPRGDRRLAPAVSHARGGSPAGPAPRGLPRSRSDRGVAGISGPSPRPPPLHPGGGRMAGGDAGPLALRSVRELAGPVLSRHPSRRGSALSRPHAERSKSDRLAVLHCGGPRGVAAFLLPGHPDLVVTATRRRAHGSDRARPPRDGRPGACIIQRSSGSKSGRARRVRRTSATDCPSPIRPPPLSVGIPRLLSRGDR